jgi:DNA polymerase
VPAAREPQPGAGRSRHLPAVRTISPKVIVALGSFAAKSLLQTDAPISRLRGRVYDLEGAKLICTFHPAYLLRSPDRKRDTWEDMKRARVLLK